MRLLRLGVLVKSYKIMHYYSKIYLITRTLNSKKFCLEMTSYLQLMKQVMLKNTELLTLLEIH